MTTSGPTEQQPFGLPVLAELPELAHALEQLTAVDRAIANALDQLVLLHADGMVESATGVDLDHWLATIARRTRSDRRMLTCVVETCARLPHLHASFSHGELSWAQLRSIVLQVHRLPRHLDDQLDTALAGAVTDTAAHDPDALTSLVRWIVDDLRAAPPEPASRPTQDVLVLQPRLDGSGGRVFGDLGPVGLAALDAATEPGPPPRANDGAIDHRSTAQRRATRLIELCLTGPLTRTSDPAAALAEPTSGIGAVPDDADRGPRTANVHVLLRAELTTLLGMGDDAATLLTHTTGGAMWTDATTARELADRAASVRLIVTEDGAPLGVGRKRRTPPGWLREAGLALHDTCSHPGCLTAARVADTDHAQPWTAGGRSDAANLAPLCATHNHRKEAGGWRVSQYADGQRVWNHPRTGLTTRTAPATWRPRAPGARTSGSPPGDAPARLPARRPPFHVAPPSPDHAGAEACGQRSTGEAGTASHGGAAPP